MPPSPSCPRLSRASTSFLRAFSEKGVDGRHKPGHDGGEMARHDWNALWRSKSAPIDLLVSTKCGRPAWLVFASAREIVAESQCEHKREPHQTRNGNQPDQSVGADEIHQEQPQQNNHDRGYREVQGRVER